MDDRVRSDGRRHGGPRGLWLDHDHRGRAGRLEHRQEQAADRPGAEDDRRLARPGIGLVHAVHDARERLDERGDAGRGSVGDREDGGRGRLDVRRQRPVAEDPERRDVLATRRPTGTARAAHAALGVRIDRHALADRQAGDSGPDRLDPPDELVAHDDADVGGMAGWHVQDLEVRAADPARLDLDDDIVVGLDGRLGNVLELDDARAFEDSRSHQLVTARDAGPAADVPDRG